MSKIIGIDLGTTNSVAAIVEHGTPRVVINEEGGRLTPSVVGFGEEGDRFVGDIAKRQMLMHPERTVHSIKRFMGRNAMDAGEDITRVGFQVEADGEGVTITVDGCSYSPQQLSAFILQKMKKSAEDFLGETVREAVITVPAYFTNRQRQATKDAGQIAGLNVLRIINEPTAAALAYTIKRRKAGTIAVYDFGGGTFDISILEVQEDVAEVRSTAGNNRLGGADLDARILDWLLGEFKKTNGVDVSDDIMVRQRLLEAAEKAKIDLSSSMETEIHLPFLTADENGPQHLQTTLTRATFEFLVEDIIEETLQECRRALEEAKLDPSEIEEVVLVGGSSRIPKVQGLIQELFGDSINKSFNPDEVVAIGAAVQAGMLGGVVTDVTLLDVTNFSLGLETQGQYMSKLIPKGSTVPVVRSQMVSTVIDNQTVVRIHILQGEESLAADNISLGQFELGNIQPAPRGMPRIEVTYTIDTDGIVNVSARDIRTGSQHSITIKSPASMSRQDLDQARRELDRFDDLEERQRTLGALKEHIERQLFALEALVREEEMAFSKRDHADAEQALKRGRMALVNKADRQSLLELSDYLTTYHNDLRGQAEKAKANDSSTTSPEPAS